MTNHVYDNYEISGCRRCNEEEKDDRQYVETCDDADAHFWTLYGHIDGQGVEAIGDFGSREAAEQVYLRITGEAFTGSYQACPRLRLMHAAPKLLTALEAFVEADRLAAECSEWKWENLEPAFTLARAAIAEATAACPPWVSGEPDIPALLARHRQIAAIWGIEDVQGLRPDLTDEQAWTVLQDVDRHHDAEFGITWLTLEITADELFGDAPDSDEAEEA